MIYNATLNDHRKVCNSCTIYIILLVTGFLIIIGSISAYFYFHLYLKINDTDVNTNTETVIC